MDWRTSDAQLDTQAGAAGDESLAAAAGQALELNPGDFIRLDAALVRALEVARLAGGRFGSGAQQDGVSE